MCRAPGGRAGHAVLAPQGMPRLMYLLGDAERQRAKGMAGRCQRRRIAAAVDQLGAEPGFERLDAAAERRLAGMACIGRARKAARGGQTKKVVDPLGVHLVSFIFLFDGAIFLHLRFIDGFHLADCVPVPDAPRRTGYAIDLYGINRIELRRSASGGVAFHTIAALRVWISKRPPRRPRKTLGKADFLGYYIEEFFSGDRVCTHSETPS
jgi:hypothetical protein